MATSEAPIIVPEATRTLFWRMINNGRDAEVSMTVMAFWMWLESQGFQEIIKMISYGDDKFLSLACAEAEAILSSLRPLSKAPLSLNLLRITPQIAPRFTSTEVIFTDKEKVSMGIDIYKPVCYNVIFKDILEERSIKVGEECEESIEIDVTKSNGTSSEGSNDQKVVLDGVGSPGSPPEGVKVLKQPASGVDDERAKLTAPLVRSKLNPSAKEWNPRTELAPEEDRCLFLTFSNGYPLNGDQITKFFTQRHGPCVERVYVHRPCPKDVKVPPLFGKVVFKASYIPAMILSGKNEAKFWVDGKTLWCKRFVPNKKIDKTP